jgi:SagB-type dehydrogenase family enzyme
MLFARLYPHVTLEARANGEIVACFEGHFVGLGQFSPGVAVRAEDLRTGLPLASEFAAGSIEMELHPLLQTLAESGFLEYRLARSQGGEDQVVIEPQTPDYWPGSPQIGTEDTIALSRFAYMRRRGNAMILESPRARALFRIANPKIATALATLSSPQQVGQLCEQAGFPGAELLALLVDCDILFKVDPARGSGLRASEGDKSLVLWDFHDLLFHARSTQGRHANPLGGVYPDVGVRSPPPAVRPRWPGKQIDLRKGWAAHAPAVAPAAKLVRRRHSTRSFDDRRPITLAELARFLDSTARVRSRFRSRLELGEVRPVVTYAVRPYPSGGGSWELELYLAVATCEGLAPGFYHYDAGRHALTNIPVRAHELDALLMGAAFAMDAPDMPQILITIAARFGRVSWKYGSIAYALILKDVGVLMQTFYLMATDMRLGGCAIGTVNIDQFARMTGMEFHVEGPVGQFAVGRPAKSGRSGARPPANRRAGKKQ